MNDKTQAPQGIQAWLRISNISGRATGVFLTEDVQLRSERLEPVTFYGAVPQAHTVAVPEAYMVFHPDGSNIGPHRFRTQEQIDEMERRGHVLKPLVYATAQSPEPAQDHIEDVRGMVGETAQEAQEPKPYGYDDFFRDAARLKLKPAELAMAIKAKEEEIFNAKRLRRVVNLLGLGSAVPESDQELLACMGTVLGMVARKLEPTTTTLQSIAGIDAKAAGQQYGPITNGPSPANNTPVTTCGCIDGQDCKNAANCYLKFSQSATAAVNEQEKP